MSIRQKRTMTEKSLKAHRRNARQSRGPVTEVGKKRSRDANISHGFYAQDGGAALEALGEDPREYQKLAGAVVEKWQPADAYEEQLGTQLVRALWRARRSDRMQEGLTLRLAQESERWRQDNLHARMTSLSLNAGCLRSLAESVEQPDYTATPSDMEMLKSFQADGVLQEMGTVIKDLLIVLRPEADRGACSLPETETREVAEPEAPEEPEGAAEPPLPAASEAGDPTPEDIDADEDDGPRGIRQTLQNILLREADLLDEQRTACLQAIVAGPSPFERAAEFASAYSEMKLLQRVEDSNFRQVWRITDLFIKLKGGAPERNEAAGKIPPRDSDAPPASAPAVETPELAPNPYPIDPQDSSSHPPAPTQPAEANENEGASGKVQLNQHGDSPVEVLAPSKQRDMAPQRTTERPKRPRVRISGGTLQLNAV